MLHDKCNSPDKYTHGKESKQFDIRDKGKVEKIGNRFKNRNSTLERRERVGRKSDRDAKYVERKGLSRKWKRRKDETDERRENQEMMRRLTVEKSKVGGEQTTERDNNLINAKKRLHSY